MYGGQPCNKPILCPVIDQIAFLPCMRESKRPRDDNKSVEDCVYACNWKKFERKLENRAMGGDPRVMSNAHQHVADTG
jgi:hypothetical protein